MTHTNYKINHTPNDRKQIMNLIQQKLSDGIKVSYVIKSSNNSITELSVDTEDIDIKNLITRLGYLE